MSDGSLAAVSSFSYFGSCQRATKDHITDKSMVGCCEIRCHCDGNAVRNAAGDAVEMLLLILGEVWSFRKARTLAIPAANGSRSSSIKTVDGRCADNQHGDATSSWPSFRYPSNY